MLTPFSGQDTASATLPAGDHSRFCSVVVVGAGLMGRRLAGVYASGGLSVTLTDAEPTVLPEAGRVAQDLARALCGSPGPVRTTARLEEALEGAGLVTEAVAEDLDVKRTLFTRMAGLTATAVLASNSSVLPITAISAGIEDPSRAVGTHWWNPPDLIPVVEVVQGESTSLDVVADVMALLNRLGKRPVRVRRDVPGFVGNRIQHALWREAIALVAEGVADAETVDMVVRDTIGLRLGEMGPLANADYVGLDLTRAIHEAVFPVLDRSSTPNPLLDDLIRGGHLGAKSGQGLFAWPPGARETAGAALAAHVSSQLAARRGATSME
ncbi:3-hydroxyacyl-CoA dehydrogenase family protein [Streptomyces scabiei]|uniref:3-hydroxyacyl-CoA dehydrogenase family protein n=1 Tax=Streptomyces scabiei TaxID=1930 RepID=UPI0029B9964C|nr:3-hydroxyacyl-CoA dehydrogenase NAD-binding domain-containing protein [Streptomyces scabiei]MDX3524605.1 3-hydroxyacyl-CoA dehydrogenase NAD-binding domain-containing protein [Streptomyces scabiei]